MNELRERFNSDSIRASTLKDGVRAIEQQMARQGLGMRGDIREADARVDYQLKEAMDYIRKGDVEQARQALQYAEGSMAQLAKFLGR